jgi:hypothetical protein
MRRTACVPRPLAYGLRDFKRVVSYHRCWTGLRAALNANELANDTCISDVVPAASL